MASSHEQPIYLDHNATSPILPEVAERLADRYAGGYVNPASQHGLGRRSRAAWSEAIEVLAHVLGVSRGPARRDQIIVTSGGTESNNMALRGLAGAPPGHLIVSSVEHPSILETALWLEQQGYRVSRLAVDQDGRIDPASLESTITADTRLVSVMMGNNETGVLQPIQELAAICRRRQVLFHTDAVQAIGKIPVDFGQLGVDALSLTAHKFHGPRGVGALVVRASVSMQPLLHGGSQQLGMRPGTEPVELTCAMADALAFYERSAKELTCHMTRLRDLFEAHLRAGCPEAVIHGAGVKRLPHTTNVSIPGLNRQALLMALDRAGVCCSTGSACSSGSSEPSHVLVAMRYPSSWVESSLRFSLGWQTTESQVQIAAERLLSVISAPKTGRLPHSGPSGLARETGPKPV